MKTKNKQTIAEKLADSHYQPTKTEKETEYDMPDANMDDLRPAFFNPPRAGRSKLDCE